MITCPGERPDFRAGRGNFITFLAVFSVFLFFPAGH